MHYPQQTQYPQALLRVSWRGASSRPGCAPDFGRATDRSLEHPEICTCFVIGVAARGISVQHSGLRNLRHLFSWLAAEYGHPLPYTDGLVRFEGARDHATIRVLTEGVGRGELVQIRLADLPADLIARPYIRVVPLKAREPPTRAGSCR
jgi:hypothetical protein